MATSTSQRTVEERVTLGEKFLDEYAPEGWRKRIDPETLDMASCSACVLGQVFGDYRTALTKLGITHTITRVLGLNNAVAETGWGMRSALAGLQERQEQVELRRAWVERLSG